MWFGRTPPPRSAALLTVAGQDVSVCGGYARPTGAAQPHGLQLGGVRPAAGAGALEGLLEHGAEGDEGVGAGRVAAVALAASQQHHLQHSTSRRQKTQCYERRVCTQVLCDVKRPCLPTVLALGGERLVWVQ